MGVGYKKEADYEYSSGSTAFMNSLIIWGFFIIIGDFLIETYFMISFIKLFDKLKDPNAEPGNNNQVANDPENASRDEEIKEEVKEESKNDIGPIETIHQDSPQKE